MEPNRSTPAKIPAIGIQLYTLRHECADDFEGALQAVSDMGYEAVETAGFHGRTAEWLRDRLDRLGLACCALHCGREDLERRLDRLAADARTLGAEALVLAYDNPKTRDDFVALGRFLEDTGRRLRDQGLALCYHNHANEFVPFDDGPGLDLMYRTADPAFLQAELDTFWVSRAGYDPVAYVAKYAGRLPILHCKDQDRRDPGCSAPVGEGSLDFAAMIRLACQGGTRWLVMEDDESEFPPLESARLSFLALQRLRKAHCPGAPG